MSGLIAQTGRRLCLDFWDGLRSGFRFMAEYPLVPLGLAAWAAVLIWIVASSR